MTPKQIELARHALGLPNRDRKSYRNRYFVSPGAIAHFHWKDMVMQGDAIREPAAEGQSSDLFFLTEQGARAALLPKEKLSEEDFPPGQRALTLS